MKTVALIFTFWNIFKQARIWILYMYAWHFQNVHIFYYHITVTNYMTEMFLFFLFVCLFVCYRWYAANFDKYSSLMTIEQWGFCTAQDIRLYGHLRGPVAMKLTLLAERLAMEL